MRAGLAQRRRLVAAALAGISVVCTISALRPSPVATRALWVAARDLTGGAPIAAGDVKLERVPSGDLPAGAMAAATHPVGRLLAAPMRRGEPLTDVRLLSPSLLTASDQPNDVAVPVRIADGAATIALVHAGDLVDVIAVAAADNPTPAAGSTAVHDVRVLATPTLHNAAATGDETAGLLIVAATTHQAAALAAAAANSQLSVAVQPRP
jgi:pilus assembly protein CpaB